MGKCSLPIPFYSAARANLRPYGAPPSIGRRESRIPAPKPFPRGEEAMREYRFPRTVISSASEKSFSLAVKKKRESIGKRETPYFIRFEITSFHSGRKSEWATKKRPQLHLGGRYEKMLLTHSFLFRCESQPPPLRGTSFHRKEGEPHPRTKAFPAWGGSDARIPFPPYRHFERKREIFFVGGQEETGEHRKMGNAVLHTLRDHGVSFGH